MGCCSFKRRTNPPSSTTEECPSWFPPCCQENVSAPISPRHTGLCSTGSHEKATTVYRILLQPRPASLLSRPTRRTDGNLLWHEPDHRAPPPLKLLAESRTPAVSRRRKPERQRSVGCRRSAPLPCSAQYGQWAMVCPSPSDAAHTAPLLHVFAEDGIELHIMKGTFRQHVLAEDTLTAHPDFLHHPC